MILRFSMAVGLLALVTGCDERPEVVVAETRALTTRDAKMRIGASSDERFRNTQPSPVEGLTPSGWLSLPSTEFRLLNYRFGESGMGEVWVSVASGTVMDNVNRWLGQFGQAALDEAAFHQLRRVKVLGADGAWVEAEGEYAAGMAGGGAPRPGHALAGVIVEHADQLLTVKMVGPKQEVDLAKADLEAFVASLVAKEGSAK